MISKVLSNKIYYATFTLAIFVIAIHVSYVDYLNPAVVGYDFSFFIQRFFIVIGDASVPTFFVISGYLLFSKFTLKGYPKMLLNKVFSLTIPYFFWSILAFLIMQIIYPLILGGTINLTFKSAIINILMSEDCKHLWFVRTLLVFFICSPLLYFIFKYLKKWSIVIPIVLFFVNLLYRPEYSGILYWIPLFFVGSYLAYFNVSFTSKIQSKVVSISVLLAFIFLALVFTINHTEYEDNSYYFYRFASPLLAWVSLDLLSPLFKKEKVREIFKSSAFIFFSHLFVVTAFKQLFQLWISVDSNYHCALLFFLVLIFASILDISIAYLLKRSAKPVYKLCGGR